VLQCVAVCCSAESRARRVVFVFYIHVRVAICCSVLQCVAMCCSVFCCNVLQHIAAYCSVLQCVAVCCSVLQCVAVPSHVLDASCVYSICVYVCLEERGE